MKKILLILFSFLIFAGLFSTSYAQESAEAAARKYGITFPVAELGGCTDYAACRTYCEDPVNQTVCLAFAKAKGFYKEDTLSQKKEELLQSAKAELGCSDRNTCQAVCYLEENFEKCNSFARRYGLQGGHNQEPGKPELIKKAKEVLGCDSEASCRAICEQEQNREKCGNFARETGLRGGEIRRGPGGCSSEETCKAFCNDPAHFNECANFGGKRDEQKFVGPGGCTDEQSCRNYCEKNPGQCHMDNQGKKQVIEDCFKSGRFWYEDKCNDKPKTDFDDFDDDDRRGRRDPRMEECFKSGKFWYDDSCHEKSFSKSEDFCRDNPERCKFNEIRPANIGGVPSSCSPPSNGCPGGLTWDRGTCTCKPSCPNDTSWNGSSCMKDSQPSYREGSSTTRSDYKSCSPPPEGCGGDKSWDRGTCTCKPGCPSGTSWNGINCMKDSSPSGSGGYTPGYTTQPSYQQPAYQPQQQNNNASPEEVCRRENKCWQDGSCRDCNQSSNTTNSSGQSVRPEEQCSREGKCWIDNACRDCNTQPSGGSGQQTSGSGGSGGGGCESRGGHMENGVCTGAVQGVSATYKIPMEQIILSLINQILSLK